MSIDSCPVDEEGNSIFDYLPICSLPERVISRYRNLQGAFGSDKRWNLDNDERNTTVHIKFMSYPSTKWMKQIGSNKFALKNIVQTVSCLTRKMNITSFKCGAKSNCFIDYFNIKYANLCSTGTPRDVLNAITTIINTRLSKYSSLNFIWHDPDEDSPAGIRVGFDIDEGDYSAVGTDALFVEDLNEKTMNLSSFNPSIIIHEFCHAIGMYHEHQSKIFNAYKPYRIYSEDQQKQDQAQLSCLTNAMKGGCIALAYAKKSLADLKSNFLNHNDHRNEEVYQYDPNSIMLYPLPGCLFTDGVGTTLNARMSEEDINTIFSMYPVGGFTTEDCNLEDNSKCLPGSYAASTNLIHPSIVMNIEGGDDILLQNNECILPINTNSTSYNDSVYDNPTHGYYGPNYTLTKFNQSSILIIVIIIIVLLICALLYFSKF